MAMRMVFRIRTAAENDQDDCDGQTDPLRDVDHGLFVMDGLLSSVTDKTPAVPLKVWTTWAASVNAMGVHQ